MSMLTKKETGGFYLFIFVMSLFVGTSLTGQSRTNESPSQLKATATTLLQGSEIDNAFALWDKEFPKAKAGDTETRDILAAIYYFVPSRSKYRHKKNEMAAAFKKKYGQDIKSVGMPAEFRGHEALAESFLKQMILSADDALDKATELKKAGEENEKAKAIVKATYRLLLYALLGYDYPTSDPALNKLGRTKLDELAQAFDLSNQELTDLRREVAQITSPSDVMHEWYSLMGERPTGEYEEWCIPGINYCIGSPKMYWTTLTTTALSVLTSVATLYLMYNAVKYGVGKKSVKTVVSTYKRGS